MSKLVVLALNPLDDSTWERYSVEDVREFLINHFEKWPDTARIYNGFVSNDNDVTPSNVTEIERLAKLDGPFFVIVYPADAFDIFMSVATMGMYLLVASVQYLVAASAPNAPSMLQRNNQQTSPNNELSERVNKARLNGRIPDIYGTVRSTPDLISVPYKMFENHQEIECSYMCIGKGFYEVSDIRDDKTLCSDIAGTSVEIFEPGTSPNSGDDPQLRIGDAITVPIRSTTRCNSVNGQVLRPPNDRTIAGSNNILFNNPNEIIIKDDAGIDFTNYFAPGDILKIFNASFYTGALVTEFRRCLAESNNSFSFSIPDSTLPALYAVGKPLTFNPGTHLAFTTQYYESSYVVGNVWLQGSYKITAVDLITIVYGETTSYRCKITLENPGAINAEWNKIENFKLQYTFIDSDARYVLPSGTLNYSLDGEYTILSVSPYLIILSNPSAVNATWNSITTTDYLSPVLLTAGSKWIGPFTLDDSNLKGTINNFVALNGLYKDNGASQFKVDVTVEVELTPINNDGSARGDAELFQIVLEGSGNLKSTRAVTLESVPTFSGKCKIRARRVTPTDYDFNGSVVDEVQWRDALLFKEVDKLDFGNVTTVHTITYGTTSALTIKERKLNMLVTRKLPARIEGSAFTTELFATNNFADITSAICLDPHIGNRLISEVDFDNIYDTAAEIQAYFGTEKATEFCYTFDNDNLSFEETLATIAKSVFCEAYRRGNVIKFSFEKETIDSVLLFNHRNKIPGTETRNVFFGSLKDNDGVEYSYVDPVDDAIVTLYIPENQSAINPKKVESIGVRNHLQAYFQAYRIWNKLVYQNTSVEFEATQEANLLIKNDRILVADNTRPDTQDGEVVSQNVLQLRLSQKVDLTYYSAYYIFLQLPDGSVESIPVTAGSDEYSVVLSRAPRLPLALDADIYARTTFALVGNTETRPNAFLVTERAGRDNFTASVKAINYDANYYAKDKDYINEIIDENAIAL